MRWTLLDFETASAVDLKKSGAWVYAESPTTEILWLSWSLADRTYSWNPRGNRMEFDQALEQLRAMALDENLMFVAFNVAFEKAIWRHIMVPEYGMPDIPNERWHDVQAVCAMKVIPQAMEKAAVILRLQQEKDMAGSKLTKSLSKPKKDGTYDRTPETLSIVGRYCLQDIRTEVEMHECIGWLPPGERKVWLLNQAVNERGLRIDLEYVRAAQQIVDEASVPMLSKFHKLTGLKPTQGEKFKVWLAERGCVTDSLDKEHMAALLGADPEGEDDVLDISEASNLAPDVRDALYIRSLIGSASIKKLARMPQCVNADGRARGLLQYHGTGPGRSAGRLLQPHNFPRPTLKDEDGELFEVDKVVAALLTGDYRHVEQVLGPPIEAVAGGLRHALIPGEGRSFMSGDYSGIQARLVLALGGCHDKTALMASGADVYCDMASAIFKRPIDKKKDPWERGIGKNSVLGLGFQMGWKTFRDKYAKDQDQEFLENVVQTYRKEWAPGVPKVWYALQDAAVAAVHEGGAHEAYGVTYQVENGWLSARLPSGRKMWYANPRAIQKAMPWDKDDIRPAITYQATKMGQWKTIDAFGGQLTENVIMGMERDLMTRAQLTCEANGLPVVLEVHDEIVVEPLTADADPAAFKQIMLDTPDWARQIKVPIAIEGWEGDRYRK